MKEQLISFKTAKLAKEKGFDWKCWNFIDIDGEEDNVLGFIGDSFEDKYLLAKDLVLYFRPTQSFLQKWLREVHNIDVWASPFLNHECKKYNNMMVNRNIDVYELLSDDKDYDTYEQALEVGLLEGLKLIKTHE